MEAKLCFVYSQINTDVGFVLNLLKERKFIHWWEIEAELALSGLNPNRGHGLGLSNGENYNFLRNEPLKGLLINLIPPQHDVVNRFLSQVFTNPIVAKFSEVRQVAWSEFGRDYWLDLEFNYSPSGIITKLTALDRHMEVYRF